jgi:hypothetical protein
MTIREAPSRLPPNFGPDVEGLISVGLGAEKSVEDRLGGVEVAEWVNDERAAAFVPS